MTTEDIARMHLFDENPNVDFHGILYRELKPLHEYARGNDSARLRLWLDPDYLKMREANERKDRYGHPLINSDTFEFNINSMIFLKALCFVGMLQCLVEAGDNEDVSIERGEMKRKIERKYDPILKDAGILRDSGDFNAVIKRLHLKYDVFSGRTGQRVSGYIISGYGLRDNLFVSLSKLP